MPAGPDIPRLDELLSALRLEGVPVGPAEAVRIRHAFGAEPRLDRDGLRKFLACLLVKRPDHERIFQQLFDAWCPDLPADALARGGRARRRLPQARLPQHRRECLPPPGSGALHACTGGGTSQERPWRRPWS
jgi:uncharacterized protein with von Willebrand factor type A (vWA) domain